MSRSMTHVRDGVVYHPDPSAVNSIHVDSAAWWRWLDDATTCSFAFRGPTGHFTARKTRRARGGVYWTAYRHVRGRVISIYLGKSSALSAERLAAAATELSQRAALAGAARTPVPQTNAPSTAGSPLLISRRDQPQLRPGLVLRPHLIARLEVARAGGIVLLAAPAGFGKSTLLSLWLSRTRQDAGYPQLAPVAWLALDAADNDPDHLLRALLMVLHLAVPSLGARIVPLLDSGTLPATFIVTTLLNDLAALTEPVTLVLDDYHHLTAPAVHAALTPLLDHRPPQLCIVIASREEPPLPLARWRAAGTLTELRAADLRFSRGEIGAFFAETMHITLAEYDVAALETRTEGWAVGIQLVALALQAHPDHQQVIAALSGTHRFIVDYLTDEVLHGLPAHLQTFLLQTSILNRLCAPLCDALLLGDVVPESSGYSQIVLEELERRNLFLLPLDGHRQWYRYHQLFRDVLHQRLIAGVSPAALAHLHRRASAWHAQHELFDAAISHALAAEDWAGAADLIEQHGLPLAARGQIHLVLGWLDRFPLPTLRARPLLTVIHAILLLLNNQPRAAEERLQAAEASQRARPDGDRDARTDGYIAIVWLTLLRARGAVDEAIDQAQRALRLLPATDFFASTAAVAATHSAWERGDVSPAAEQQLLAALNQAQAAGNLISVVHGMTGLARIREVQGRLYAAADTYRAVLQVVPEAMLAHLFSGVSYFVGLGAVLYEQNQLDAAMPLLERGVEISRGATLVYPSALIQGYGTLARLRQARGDVADATRLLTELMQRARQRGLTPVMLARIAAAQAELALAQGDRGAAMQWASAADVGPNAAHYLCEAEQLILARVWIAEGRQQHAAAYLRFAHELLARLRLAAAAQGRVDSLISIDMLRALALADSDPQAAGVALEQALRAAAPLGYVRRFLDEGAPMTALLQQIQHQSAVPDYVARLLSAAQKEAGGRMKDAERLPPFHPSACFPQPLVEPLTARELEVLHLLVAGRNTSAIAQELIVSAGTVKRHVSNLMGKLGVHSRLEAVARARLLGLIT